MSLVLDMENHCSLESVVIANVNGISQEKTVKKRKMNVLEILVYMVGNAILQPMAISVFVKMAIQEITVKFCQIFVKMNLVSILLELSATMIMKNPNSLVTVTHLIN